MRKAGIKQRQSAGDWEQLTNRQQRRITRLYDEWSASTRRALTDLARRGGTIAEQEALLERKLREFEGKMQQVYGRGIEIAANASAGARKEQPRVQGLIANKKAEGDRMISSNLVPLMLGSLAGAIAAGDAMNPKVLMADFNAVRSMPPQYSGGAWVMIFEVQRELGKQREHERKLEGLVAEKIRWVLDPRAEHCASSPGYHGCPDLTGEYNDWDSLPTVPAGQVTCRGNCRCHLEVFRDGQWQRGVYAEDDPLTKASADTYHRGNGANAAISLEYDPAQPRDEDGKWAPGGGGGKTAEDEWAEEVFGDTRPDGTERNERRSGDSLSARLTDAERETVDQWQGFGYNSIRNTQKRGQTSPANERWQSALDQCDPYVGQCYRGGALSPETQAQFRNATQADLDNMVIEMKADSSASKERGVGEGFIRSGDRVREEGYRPVLYSFATESAADLTSLSSEGEVILRKGMKFRPTALRYGQKFPGVAAPGIMVTLREIPAQGG